jgi:hypothetical protein
MHKAGSSLPRNAVTIQTPPEVRQQAATIRNALPALAINCGDHRTTHVQRRMSMTMKSDFIQTIHKT